MNTTGTDDDRARVMTPPVLETSPVLAPGDVHVWSAYLDEPDPVADEALLSPDEQVRAARYRFERDRVRFVVGRARLRRLLGHYTGRAPGELVFETGRYGKPHLTAEPGEPPLHFNVTHADALALYAFSRTGEIGIDVEHLRVLPDWSLIADGFFSVAERDELARFEPSHRPLAFLELWTRREALLKALGEGLIGESQGRASARDAQVAVQKIATEPGYVAALAAVFPPERIFSFDWSGAPRVTSAAALST